MTDNFATFSAMLALDQIILEHQLCFKEFVFNHFGFFGWISWSAFLLLVRIHDSNETYAGNASGRA
jgi:hypothetical protein